MSSELVSAAADFGAFLEESVPDAWKVRNAYDLGTSKLSGVVLSYQQLDVLTQATGEQLPLGYVWITFRLVLSSPETDAKKGVPRVTRELATLLQVLDASPDIEWTEAEFARVETGESAFFIPVAFLATNFPPAPPTPEPAISPDDSEEE